MVIVYLYISDDQVAATKKTPREWWKEKIIKGLKLRFALGLRGYKYLRDTELQYSYLQYINQTASWI